MSDTTATYTFLPWLRRGIATTIPRREDDGTTAPRVALDVGLTLNAGATTTSIALYGPGEVTGINPRVVVRTWPRADSHDAEPNFFPLIEFDQADLPWRYTPARPNDADPQQPWLGNRLSPWICLIALKESEIGPSDYEAAGANRPLARVKISDASLLPDLSQSWAWAHVQVSGAKSVDATAAADLLVNQPERVTARLLAALRMDEKTAYKAFVVPTFERGRLAGLGDLVKESVDALTPAWSAGAQGFYLPIYYEWRFKTGTTGDFEFLVRQLTPRKELPPSVGIRDMDVSAPGADLPPAADGPLGLEGALKAPTTESTTWKEPTRGTFIAKLALLLNRPADLLKGSEPVHVVAPPLYGQWYAETDRLDPKVDPSGSWFDDLNADPRLRVASGLGTMVVQTQQRQLMASAWQQAATLRRANEELRLSQLAREVAARIHKRHVDVGDDQESVLQLTAPLHSRVQASPRTVAAHVRESPIAPGALEPQWRRAARPLGPLGRRQGRPALPKRSTMLGRMNQGTLSPAPVPPTPDELATTSKVGAGLVPAWATATVLAILRVLPVVLLIAAIVCLLAAVLLFITGWPRAAAAVAGVCVLLLIAALLLRPFADDLLRRVAFRDGTLTPAQIRSVPSRPDFVAAETPPGGTEPVPPPPGPSSSDSASARRFREATASSLTRTGAPPAESPPLPSVDLADLRAKVVDSLDPRVTIAAAIQSRLRIDDSVVTPQSGDPLSARVSAPKFPQPMYAPLRDLSQDWLLPGLDGVPPNTISLLTTNQRFVEAYLLGLNDAMGKELFWNEYPNHARATYFRQFWDPAGYVAPAAAGLGPDDLTDIKPIDQWQRGTALGEHSGRTLPQSKERVVLLARGAVVEQYHNILVYAARARWDANGTRQPGDEERHPLFSITLKPDVACFGFDLTLDEVIGSSTGPAAPSFATTAISDPGWFFAFAEHHGEPRFGLDARTDTAGQWPTSWQDLSWGHLVDRGVDPSTIHYVNLASPLPDTRYVADPAGSGAVWHVDKGTADHGASAADIAYISLRHLVRVFWHASGLLRAGSGPP